MGVAGCGKSTLGAALAAALGCEFVEGDGLHPPANIAKMRAGVALDDADRAPFLDNVGRTLAKQRESGVVVSCSVLKRVYRDTLRQRCESVRFVLPALDREVLATRLAERQGHFMPTGLLDSQLATYEAPTADEAVIVIDGLLPTQEQVRRALAAIGGPD